VYYVDSTSYIMQWTCLQISNLNWTSLKICHTTKSWYRRAGYGFNGDFAIRNFLFLSNGIKVANLAFQFSVRPLQVLLPRPRYLSSAYPSPELNDHSALFSFHFLRRGPLRCFLLGEEFLTKLSCNLFVCGPNNWWERTILCNLCRWYEKQTSPRH
jgi:hypothetical protein